MRNILTILCLATASLTLSGCDALGIETAPQIAAKKDAEAHAIGSACRHAIRSIEVCFQSNPKAVKAAMFNGWKEMDTYMRENEILGMPSQDPPAAADSTSRHDSADPGKDGHAPTAHKS
ncbi:hypothetical protein LPB72_01920 [Hydrogenophaga crassostreae]|uniref:Lipoprotein n=1 Tax=Hydrogenophaga crassostreae TaxID=1763535 RepID=A0A162T884_9BURK|nr:hypothetical protein [Hydrogenophaga crassostreae]AOW13773.1 hypothetical protein LPB072_13905 [Hydrogenophaga crassostreae]OAD44264.1 hypothetical protein LPB72_01920 [Hydrogenophaga crassostreae]